MIPNMDGNTEQFFQHLNISSHADIGCQVDKDFVLLSLNS